MVSWGSFPLKNQDYAVSTLPNTQRKQTQKWMYAVRKSQFPSHHGTSQQVNIDYIFLVPLAIISDTIACCQIWISPLVSMGISDRVRREFSLKNPGRKAPSNYKHLIHIPSTGVLGKWQQASSLKIILHLMPPADQENRAPALTQKAGKKARVWLTVGKHTRVLVLLVFRWIIDTASGILWVAEVSVVRRWQVCYSETDRG